MNRSTPTGRECISVDFEVYGKVQRVHFRKFTAAKAIQLGLRGWCENTTTGTVIGVIEGPKDRVEAMKLWLSTVGSPKSRIERIIFGSEKKIQVYTFANFKIKL